MDVITIDQRILKEFEEKYDTKINALHRIVIKVICNKLHFPNHQQNVEYIEKKGKTTIFAFITHQDIISSLPFYGLGLDDVHGVFKYFIENGIIKKKQENKDSDGWITVTEKGYFLNRQ